MHFLIFGSCFQSWHFETSLHATPSKCEAHCAKRAVLRWMSHLNWTHGTVGLGPTGFDGVPSLGFHVYHKSPNWQLDNFYFRARSSRKLRRRLAGALGALPALAPAPGQCAGLGDATRAGRSVPLRLKALALVEFFFLLGDGDADAALLCWLKGVGAGGFYSGDCSRVL